MPYARRSFRRYRKPYRRSRKTGGRRRFARKKFYKSVPRGLKAGLYIPKEAFVKLPFTQIINGPELTNTNYNLGIWGNGICCPLSTSASPSPGDLYPIGVQQYSTFYQNYRVLGASVKVQINCSGAIPNGSFYCALTTAQGVPYDTDPSSNWFKLSSATTQDLISYPGTSWRLASQQNGSLSNIFLKRFGKTKSIIGVKDVRDNEDCLCPLPNTVPAQVNGFNPGSQESAWFFILRVDPNLQTTVPADSFQIIIKVKYYVQLTGRDYNNQLVVPTP